MNNSNNNLTVAAIQMVSTTKWQDNLIKACELVKLASHNGAKLVVLPEFFIRIADTTDTEFNFIVEELGEGYIQNQLSQAARDNQVYLIAGTIPTRCHENNKCYNTAIVYGPDGNIITHYHKIHLFKFDNGQQRFDESRTFTHGDKIVTCEIEGYKLGLSICYDLRFPELFRSMYGVDAIIMSAAFVHHTGQAHWEILLRARAIENQCYIIASGQGGVHENGRHTFGHSMIIDPWGKINSVLSKGEGIVMSEIDLNLIKQIRTELPALDNIRLK